MEEFEIQSPHRPLNSPPRAPAPNLIARQNLQRVQVVAETVSVNDHFKDEQENTHANTLEDLELFELLEKAADTSGCSNVSMLLQHIADQSKRIVLKSDAPGNVDVMKAKNWNASDAMLPSVCEEVKPKPVDNFFDASCFDDTIVSTGEVDTSQCNNVLHHNFTEATHSKNASRVHDDSFEGLSASDRHYVTS